MGFLMSGWKSLDGWLYPYLDNLEARKRFGLSAMIAGALFSLACLTALFISVHLNYKALDQIQSVVADRATREVKTYFSYYINGLNGVRAALYVRGIDNRPLDAFNEVLSAQNMLGD